MRHRKGHVNHETYKVILAQLEARIAKVASRGGTRFEFAVPPFTLGRPPYDVTHAVRYCRDKLRIAGFEVETRGTMLTADWRPARSAARATPATPARPAAPATPVSPSPASPGPRVATTTADITKRLAAIKRRFQL